MAARKKESTAIEQLAAMGAIRQRCRNTPISTIGDRLAEIALLASGEAVASDFHRKAMSIPEIVEARKKDDDSNNRKRTGGMNRGK